MTTELTTRQATLPAAQEFQTQLQMADVLLKSKLLPSHITTPQAAFAIIQKGRELGIAPMYALSNIAVIQGKPTANAELMLALIYRDQGDEAVKVAETDGDHCTIAYKRRSWKKAEHFTFSMEDAKRAGLSGTNWQKYPGAMLRARCISAVARMAFPDSLGGMYTPEELGVAVEVDGEGQVQVIEGQAVNTHTGEILETQPSDDPLNIEMRRLIKGVSEATDEHPTKVVAWLKDYVGVKPDASLEAADDETKTAAIEALQTRLSG